MGRKTEFPVLHGAAACTLPGDAKLIRVALYISPAVMGPGLDQLTAPNHVESEMLSQESY